MTEVDAVAFLRGEIDRLQLQLRAEQAHNRRLAVAVAHYKEAYGIGYGSIFAAASDCNQGLESDFFSGTIKNMSVMADKADALLLPVADPAP